jgi:hypothetical protein
MKTFQKLIFLFLLTLFAENTLLSCKKKEQTNHTTDSATAAKMPTTPHWSRSFSGKLAGMDIVMHLTQTADIQGVKALGGFYYFANEQQPIPIYGEVGKDGKVKLSLYEQDENAEKFEGKFEQNAFAGTWSQPTTKKTATFNLVPFTEGVAFEYVMAADSFRLFQDKKYSPVANFSMGMLVPTEKNDKTLNDLLLQVIFKNMRGDTIERKYAYKGFADFYAEQQKQYFDNYKEMLRGEVFEPNQTEFDMSNYYAASDMGLVWNDGKLLSLAFHTSAYSGGAHGNYGTAYVSIDLSKKKVITLKDIFKAGFEKPLDALLEKIARKKRNISPKETLDSYFLVQEIHANDNFAVTPKGIMFNYVPYEIASYADGEIQLFVPFEDLKAFLK